jgi:hypothetical protein
MQCCRDRDQRLNSQEAQAIPWIARHFKRLDEDRDGKVMLAELWRMQRLLAPLNVVLEDSTSAACAKVV